MVKKTTTKNKTTKHTIEFSNNTPDSWATLPLYCIWTETSNPVRQSKDWGRGLQETIRLLVRKSQIGSIRGGLGHAFYLSAQADQVLDEQRIPAVDVEHVVYLGITVGNEAGQHQPRPCPDV